MSTDGRDHPEEHRRGERVVIGWSELVDFPEWGITGLPAKVDTGAQTSALHVENLEVLSPSSVCFEVVLDQRKHHRVWVRARILKWARVRSSSGHYTQRCFVLTRVCIAGVEKDIEISLVSRETMVFRMLIGRSALERDFIVDVSRHREPARRAKRRVKKRRTHED
jgi:hypothetical protein